VDANKVKVDESALTGEPDAIEKVPIEKLS
jgi:magnesium-transporting ATPase (P-type)